jgi:hypothetical protein
MTTTATGGSCLSRRRSPLSKPDGPRASVSHCFLTINNKISDLAGLNGDGSRGKSLEGLNQSRIAASQP